MYQIARFFKLSIITLLSIVMVGCATMPKDILKPSQESLKKRQLQMREYDTKDEKLILSACAGVFQDLGFILDESETKLGLVVGSKDRDATEAGQVAAATFITILAAMGGSSSNAFETIDDVQKIRASVVSKLSSDGSKMLVRVTFQRIVWNNAGNISKMETIDDPELYEGFFERLSKAVFLEAHKI